MDVLQGRYKFKYQLNLSLQETPITLSCVDMGRDKIGIWFDEWDLTVQSLVKEIVKQTIEPKVKRMATEASVFTINIVKDDKYVRMKEWMGGL